MTVIDLDAIDRTPVEHDPFDFFVVRNCIGREVLTAINQDYPEIEGPGNPAVRQVEYGPAFGDLLDAIQSPEFASMRMRIPIIRIVFPNAGIRPGPDRDAIKEPACSHTNHRLIGGIRLLQNGG